jgi:vacuolar iron transporter family protein
VFGSYFILGSLPSVVPFACTTDPQTGVIAAAVLCALACFAVGAIKTITTKGNLWTSGFENLFFACAGAGLSYGIGAAYEHNRSKV